MDKITADIKNNNTENVYLFYGEDSYKRRVYKDSLRSALYSNEMNYSYFEGESVNLRSVYESCVSVPFFAPKRLVIVENSGKFKAKGAQKGTDEEILEIIKDLPSSTCLAFFEEEAAKTKKIYKEISRKGAVCECRHDSEQTVAAWLKKGFAGASKKAGTDVVYAMIERAGVDYERLKKEFDKVIAYAGDNEAVTRADVEAVTGQSVEAKTFEIIKACSQKNPALMLDIYYALIENEVHPLIILAALRSQFELMLRIGELGNKGFSDAEIARKLGKAEFIIRNSKKTLRSFTLKETEDIIEKITLTDKQIKDGDANERFAVELLLAQISA